MLSRDPHLLEVDALLERVVNRIAPTWPLDRFIAVNPLWGHIDRPLPEVSRLLASLSGARLLMPRSWFREAWLEGRFREEDLEAAIEERGEDVTVEQLLSLMESEEPPRLRRARVMDVADAQRNLLREVSWCDFIIHSSSQFCASYFDEGQALLGPERSGGLYASWRRFAVEDQSPALLMGFDDYRQLAVELPSNARDMIVRALTTMDIPVDERDRYLSSLLLDLNGWASWCAQLGWSRRFANESNDSLVDLLGIRLAWEWLLFRAGDRGLSARWQLAMASWPGVDAAARSAQAHDWLLQRALEIAFERRLSRTLTSAPLPAKRTADAVLAVFCIDVRSEVFRRALEAEGDSVSTLGFAGFFGLPIAYQPAGVGVPRPQLPGLLAPRFSVGEDSASAEIFARRTDRLMAKKTFATFKKSAFSAFSFVESLGLLYAAQLVGDALGLSSSSASRERAGLTERERASRKPGSLRTLEGGEATLDTRTEVAASILRGMSLTRDLPRLVLFVGHGSATHNNPHAAGLDCGACCGQTGEVNARVAAGLLNDPEVRRALSFRGIAVPEDTVFAGALHDTTTEDVRIFDTDELPVSHAEDVRRLKTWLESAGCRARRERASSQGLAHLSEDRLWRTFRARSRDWSEVRPEWGLVNNAALLVAPRARTRNVSLEGRVFLHDYRFQDDADLAILELILSGPMVVAHWINFQYYASTVDHARYGSGNKVLHNVVGGHIGVFEGNGGDLRTGLPMQSLHDGKRWIHTPHRLSVLIEAPRAAIDAVLSRQEKLRSLVENEWLHLFQIETEENAVYFRKVHGRWARMPD